MAIRRKSLKFVETQYHVSSSLAVLAGSSRQLSLADGTYYPDRAISPLVIAPKVSLKNTDTGDVTDDAASTLTSGAWYRLDATTAASGLSSATAISPGSLYDIDTTLGSSTYGKLTIKENLPPNVPATFVFQARTKDGKPLYLSMMVSSQAVPFGMPKICFNNNPLGLYNPVEDEANFYIRPMLAPNPNVTVSWAWESYHNNTWGALHSTRLDWAVSTPDSYGGITIDRSIMQQGIVLRVKASFTLNGVAVVLTKDVTHTRRLPKIEFDAVGFGDMSETIKTISPKMLVNVGKKTLAESKASELDIGWFGSGNARIASGLNPSISLSSLGSDMSLGYEVKDKGGWSALVDADGKFIVDSDGKTIITR